MKLDPSLFGAIAAIFMVGLASAQTPSQVSPHEHLAAPSGFTTQAASADESKRLTLVGCLMRHKDVLATNEQSHPGPAGYLLVAVRIVSHHPNSAGMRSARTSHNASGPHAHDAPRTATSGWAGAPNIDSSRDRIADSQMFKLAGVPLERLAKMNRRQVQVFGYVDTTTAVDTRESNRRSTDDLGPSTFVAMSIHAADGMCPKR